jgi:hypothetical protein
MGTSTANSGTSGSGTPLIPSWLDDDGSAGGQPTQGGDGTSVSPPPIPEPADARRYAAPRSAFSRFARSGGTSRGSLGSAVSGYVSRTSGGPKGAAQRMGSSRATGQRLLGFLSDAATRGISEALRSLNLSELAGRPAAEIFKGLADYVCPEGGNIDVAIARDAFYQTIVDLEAEGITDFDSMNSDQVQTIFEMFATHAIEDRIYNEIGTKAITLPADTAAINNVQAQLHDFINNGVTDALNSMKDRLQNLPQDKVLEFVDDVYEKAFTVLQTMGEAEKDNA